MGPMGVISTPFLRPTRPDKGRRLMLDRYCTTRGLLPFPKHRTYLDTMEHQRYSDDEMR